MFVREDAPEGERQDRNRVKNLGRRRRESKSLQQVRLDLAPAGIEQL